MNAQDIELWARDIIDRVLGSKPVEDSRVELKATWIEGEKAASRLAGHANAARGLPILWLIGVDENNKTLTNINHLERESWYTSVQRHFDGFAPRLSCDVNLGIAGSVVVALYFETDREAPYVIKSSKGGFPDFIVPWREGTRLRAARRDELLRILVPIRRFTALLDELEFNSVVAKVSDSTEYVNMWGCLFRDEEFHRVIRDGAINGLREEVKQKVFEAYVSMGRANQRVSGTLNASMAGTPGAEKSNEALRSVLNCLPYIDTAKDALIEFLRGDESEA
jgi:hypothetical protein